MKSNFTIRRFRSHGCWRLFLVSLAALSGRALAILKTSSSKPKKKARLCSTRRCRWASFRTSTSGEEKYPFLNIRHVRINSGNQAPKILLEHKAGKMQSRCDRQQPRGDALFQGARCLGESRFAGNQPTRQGFGRSGRLLGRQFTSDLYITAYNTKFLAIDKAPRSFDDNLDPRWKDQIAVNRGVPDGLIGMLELRGDDKGMAYMRRLGGQGLRPIDGFTHMTNLLAAGEYPLAIFMQVSKIDAMKKRGAPVSWLPTAQRWRRFLALA